jgi:tetratricopeptide (TPR) repeat protein
VPSLAEGLLKLGAKAVLGWGQTVLDTDATAAAAVLYGELAAGYEVTEALSVTYQALIKQQARDWHLLRLYVGRTLPGQLVTTLRTPGRKRAPKPSVAEQFLDVDTKQVKVASRGSFVGRRRQLQNCLRALKNPPNLLTKAPAYQGGNIGGVGVLIHGMGGLGKSTLAARLCDRLPEFERLVWVGRVDEPSLVKRLTDKLPKELRQVLQSFDDELKFRLRDVFAQLEEDAAQPFLLVLDDFEHNLEPRNDGYVLQPEAARVLEALLWAIEETYARHRVIITCRYDFESEWLQKFYKQPLEGLRGADEEKKCNRLSAFGVNSQVDEALQVQARRLADGNPRLLEWLDKVLRNLDPPQPSSLKLRLKRGEQNIVAEILARLEADPVELREQVLAEALLAQIDKPLEEMLRRGLVFELPVPREALAAVCEGIPNLDKHIDRAVALGLLEVSPDQSLRVPRLLPLKLPNEAEGLYSQAAKILNQAWRVETGGYLTEEQCIEIHRLALLGTEEVIATETSSALSVQWHQQSRFREAVNICRTTLEIVEHYSILNNLARSERKIGDIDSAIEHYQRALEISPMDNKLEKGTIINNLAVIYRETGQINQAISFNQQSLRIFQYLADSKGQILALVEKARLYTLQGQLNESIFIYQKCLELFRNVREDIQGELTQYKATILHNLANIYSIQKQFDQAIPLYQHSLEIKEYIGDIQGYSVTLNSLAFIYANQGQFDQAIPLYKYSLELKEHIGDLNGKAAILHNLAYIYWMQGQPDEAAVLYEKVIEIYEQTRNVEENAKTLLMMGQLLAYKKGDFDTALAYLQQSLDILQRLQSPEVETVRQAIATVKQMAGDRG